MVGEEEMVEANSIIKETNPIIIIIMKEERMGHIEVEVEEISTTTKTIIRH